MSNLYDSIENEFDLIDDASESELLSFNFMRIKRLVFQLIREHEEFRNVHEKLSNLVRTKEFKQFLLDNPDIMRGG